MSAFRLIVVILIAINTLMLNGKTYKVYFLAGQSNMEGYGYTKQLPKELLRPGKIVPIYHGNSALDNQQGGGVGQWTPLQAGHGVGFKTDGVTNYYSNRFGPELSFAQTLLTHTAENIAIIKYATGGTGLSEGVGYSNWEPMLATASASNQYNFARQTIKGAFIKSDIDGDYELDTLIPAGIVWMQGEADAHHSLEAATAYQTKLTNLMRLMRLSLGNEQLPIIIGKINRRPDQGSEPEMPYIDVIHSAQAQFSDNDVCTEYVTETEKYQLSEDRWHYDSDSYIEMGRAFAQAMLKLQDCQATSHRSAKTLGQ